MRVAFCVSGAGHGLVICRFLSRVTLLYFQSAVDCCISPDVGMLRAGGMQVAFRGLTNPHDQPLLPSSSQFHLHRCTRSDLHWIGHEAGAIMGQAPVALCHLTYRDYQLVGVEMSLVLGLPRWVRFELWWLVCSSWDVRTLLSSDT